MTANDASGEMNPEVAEWMELFDELLAQQDVPIYERPLRAAVMLTRSALVQVRHQGVDELVEGTVGFGDLIRKPWFGRVVRMSDGWYTRIFGPAALRSPEPNALGVIMHRGAIQTFQIPLIISQQAEVTYQRWIAFPDHVEDSEDVLSWIEPALDREKIRKHELAALAEQARRIAHSIRFIASRARNASRGSDELVGLLGGTVRNLQTFANLAVVGQWQERQKAWWELQMANESFLKAFCLQKGRSGGYRRVHSLPVLVRNAQEHGLDFDLARLAGWPTERDMSDHRYATGRRVSSGELFSAYEVTLSLCEAVASRLEVKFDTGKGRMLIQPLPWRLKELKDERS